MAPTVIVKGERTLEVEVNKEVLGIAAEVLEYKADQIRQAGEESDHPQVPNERACELTLLSLAFEQAHRSTSSS